MKELETYIQQATTGLWGRKKQEVWQELEANLKLRIQDLQVQGFSPEQATARAIAEMGEPQEVSMGMQRIYTLPKIGLALLTAIVITGVSLFWLNQAKAQVEWVFFGFITGERLTNELTFDDQFFDAASLGTALTKQGVGVNAVGNNLEMTFPNRPKFSVQVEAVKLRNQDNTEMEVRVVKLPKLLAQAERAGVVPSLEGWENGVLKLDLAELGLWQNGQKQVSDGISVVIAYMHYTNFLRSSIQTQFKMPVMETRSSSNPGCRHVVEVTGPPNQLYALVTTSPTTISQSGDSERFRKSQFDLARADATGKLEFRVGTGKLEFTTDPSRIKPQATTTADAVMLMRVTGQIKEGNLILQPVMPSKPTSQSIPGTCFSI